MANTEPLQLEASDDSKERYISDGNTEKEDAIRCHFCARPGRVFVRLDFLLGTRPRRNMFREPTGGSPP